jgi:hypothetical protein
MRAARLRGAGHHERGEGRAVLIDEPRQGATVGGGRHLAGPGVLVDQAVENLPVGDRPSGAAAGVKE